MSTLKQPGKPIRGVRLAWASVLIATSALVTACGSSSGPSASQLPPGVISPAEAWKHLGEKTTVRFHVGYTGSSSAGSEFLDEKVDYRHGFVAVIYSNVVGNFGSDPIATYGGRTVDVTGYLKLYDGHPEVELFEPDQIQLAR